MGASLGLPNDTVTYWPRCLWSCARVAAPRTTWCDPSTPCPERTGGATAAPVLDNRTGTSCPSISTSSKSVPVYPATYLSWWRRGRAIMRDVATSRPHRVQEVRPVPPVERRVRDQRAQAAAEGQRRRHQCHGQGRAEQHGAHGNRPARVVPLERHAHANDSWRGQSRPRQRRRRSSRRRTTGYAAEVRPGAGAPAYASSAATVVSARNTNSAPSSSTVASKENPRDG